MARKAKFNINDCVKVISTGEIGYVTKAQYSESGRCNLYTVHTRQRLKGGNFVGEFESTQIETYAKHATPTPACKHTVDEDFIKQAHKSACPEWQRKLEDRFPEVFENPLRRTMYDFFKGAPIESCKPFKLTVDTTCSNIDPIEYIANGVAPGGEEGLWLVTTSNWEPVIKKHNGRNFIGFRKIDAKR